MSDDTSENTAQGDQQPDGETLYRRRLFDTYWIEQQTRERANSDRYDNAILAYSTGALGLSITFIKDFVPLVTANDLWVIKTSWVLFAVSLLLMLASFPIAGKANRQSIESAHEYFINCKEDHYNKDRWATKILKWLNLLAGFVFFAASAFTIAFVWINVHDKERTAMTDQKPPPTSSPRSSVVTEGLGSASMPVVKSTPSAASPETAPTNDGMPSAFMRKIVSTDTSRGVPSAQMQPAPPAPSKDSK